MSRARECSLGGHKRHWVPPGGAFFNSPADVPGIYWGSLTSLTPGQFVAYDACSVPLGPNFGGTLANPSYQRPLRVLQIVGKIHDATDASPAAIAGTFASASAGHLTTPGSTLLINSAVPSGPVLSGSVGGAVLTGTPTPVPWTGTVGASTVTLSTPPGIVIPSTTPMAGFVQSSDAAVTGTYGGLGTVPLGVSAIGITIYVSSFDSLFKQTLFDPMNDDDDIERDYLKLITDVWTPCNGFEVPISARSWDISASLDVVLRSGESLIVMVSVPPWCGNTLTIVPYFRTCVEGFSF